MLLYCQGFWNKNMKGILFLLFFSVQAFGHGKMKHSAIEAQVRKEVIEADAFKTAYESIISSYKKSVEPIFKGKCFNCHSAQTSYPWYYQIPGVNILINSHIKDGRKHLDLQNGYPFQGHGTPQEDLNEIEKVVKTGSMPPKYYQLFHGNSSLSKKESIIILDWVKSSTKTLKDLK